MAQTSGLSADRAPRSRGLHPEEHGGVAELILTDSSPRVAGDVDAAVLAAVTGEGPAGV